MGKRRAPAVFLLVLLAAASVLAYGHAGLAGRITAVVAHVSGTTEPVVLLLSGSAMLGIAGALRRRSL